jgi:uncharacterized membrane protein HdeD (DUF308 family)
MQPVDDRPFLRERVRQHWWLFLVLGFVLVILGFVAIGASEFLTDVAIYAVGTFLIISGFFHAVQAFRGWGWRGAFLHIIAGIFEVLLGLWMLFNPDHAADLWTLLIAVFLIGGGLARVVLSVIFRNTNWLGSVLSGVLNILIGLVVLSHWPTSADWFIGLCIAISILGNGFSSLMFALALRNMPEDTPGGGP